MRLTEAPLAIAFLFLGMMHPYPFILGGVVVACVGMFFLIRVLFSSDEVEEDSDG